MAEVPLVALDLESTGLNPGLDEIVSVGLIPFSVAGIALKNAEYWLLKPQQELDATVIHGITHSDVRRAPDLEKIFADLLEALAGKVVVVHYLKIERNFLFNAFMNRLGEGLLFPVIDTMAIESKVQRKNMRLRDKLIGRPIPSVRLADSRSRYGLPLYQSHHALIDALATAELFLAQLAHHFSPDLPVKALWQ